MKKIAVLAGTFKQYNEFTKHWVCPEDRNKFVYVDRVEKILGMEFLDVVRIGSYDDVRNHDELYYHSKMRIR